MPAYVQLLVLIAALVGFWAIAMRPARNQQRSMQQLQSEIGAGDEVVISAGIFGTVRSVEDAKVTLEIAPGTVITVARQVVVRRVEDESTDSVDSTHSTDSTDVSRAPDDLHDDEESE